MIWNFWNEWLGIATMRAANLHSAIMYRTSFKSFQRPGQRNIGAMTKELLLIQTDRAPPRMLREHALPVMRK